MYIHNYKNGHKRARNIYLRIKNNKNQRRKELYVKKYEKNLIEN